jgi:ATP-dependent Clp protease ATP-binding subunit ClpB
VAAAALSSRYISDRFLPDKAIDCVDEAMSRLRIEIDSMPAELDQVERRLRQLEIESAALAKEKDAPSRERRKKAQQDIAELSEKAKAMRARWQAEKDIIEKLKQTGGSIEEAQTRAAREEREGRLEKVAQIRYGEIPAMEKERQALSARLKELQEDGGGLLKEEVDEEDIAEVISRWTGIPVSRLVEGERQKLITMEERLRSRVIGQDDAVVAVSDAVRRSRAGLADPNRPIGSFLFLGPTGVGKTELARALAEFLFNDEKAMIRVDMSEFQEKHSVARLIGAPPGYVGYEEGGYLTEAVRRRPYSVVLLDEVEKAHSEVFNVLLQVLDDGRLTDGKGRTVDFKQTLVIMTSNLGSQILLERDPDDAGVRESIEGVLRSHFRPEFLNRIDETVLFHRLTQADLRKIVEKEVGKLAATLAGKHIALHLTDEAKDLLAREGFDPAFGARPLKRVIQQRLQNRLAGMLLAGEVHEGDEVFVEAKADELVIRGARGEAPARGGA